MELRINGPSEMQLDQELDAPDYQLTEEALSARET